MLYSYKKRKPSTLSFRKLITPFYKVILYFILFFIFIGDSLIFFFATTIRGIRLFIKNFYRLLNIIYRSIDVGFRRVRRFVLTLSFPPIYKTIILAFRKAVSDINYFLRVIDEWLYEIYKNVISIRPPKLRLPTLPRISIALPRIPRRYLFSLHLPKIKSKRTVVVVDRPTAKIKYFVLGSAFAIGTVFIFQGYQFIQSLPNPRLIGSVNFPLSTHIRDRNGKLLYEVYRDQNRTPVRLSTVPQYVVDATIAIEDKDYYHHNGVSIYSGIARAFKETVLKGDLQGGSTITQQLVKSALLTPERTLSRKIKEIILALWTEQLFTKKEILEMYLNQVPYGGSSYGIEEASKTYFGKSARDLTLDEAALLAGLPQAPSLYSPYSNPKAAMSRRNDVVRKMYEQHYITEKQRDNILKKSLAINPLRTTIHAPHFVFYVKQQLEERYGIQQVEEGGLRVVTSLDLEIQTQAEKILKDELKKLEYLNVTNGGILITRPSTGEILAMVGSTDYFAAPSGAFNVTTALRQPGSSIKPVMYSLALEKGFTAASILEDSPVVFANAGSEAYRPVNYDGKFHGNIPFRFALANSYNIPAVRLLNSIGVDPFVEYATNMGISTWTDSSRYGLSLTLGGGEVKMTDMATAFGVFANGGFRVDVNPIVSMKNVQGDSLYELSPEKVKVISEGNAYIISDILSDNFARQWAFGPRSLLEIPGYKVAVKTGTTDNKKDNWTIGYTPEFLVVVWVGNNDNTPMNPQLTSGITGAAPIWSQVMSYLLKNYSTGAWYEKPEDVVEKVCYFGRKEYFIKGTENAYSCNRKILESSNPSNKPNPVN